MSPSKLAVRRFELDDIPLLANYWLQSDQAHLESMGVDIDKLPSREDFTHMLTYEHGLPIENRNSYCLIWDVNNKPIGHCNTNPTTFGEEAWFHTHIWSSTSRKLGYGGILLKMSIRRFFHDLELKKLIGEPFAKNPAPNRLLKKLGFSFIKEYETIPGSLSSTQLVNRWELDHLTVRSWNHDK